MCIRDSFWVTFNITPALGLTGDLTNDPAGVVKKYLSLDKNGVRLQPLSYETVKPYISWEEEPAWGQVVVILKFSVNNDVSTWNVISNTEAAIPVVFQIVGLMQLETATFLSEPREEKIYFRIRAINNRWRIVAPMLPPHVGRTRLIDFVHIAILEEENEKRANLLRRLKRSLEKAKQ